MYSYVLLYEGHYCVNISANEDARTTSVQTMADVTTAEYSATEPPFIGRLSNLSFIIHLGINEIQQNPFKRPT